MLEMGDVIKVTEIDSLTLRISTRLGKIDVPVMKLTTMCHV